MFRHFESESGIYSKMPVNRKLRSRETQKLYLDIYRQKLYLDRRLPSIYKSIHIGLMFGHFESECSIQQNACRTGIYAITRRKKCICNRESIYVRIQSQIDGFVNETRYDETRYEYRVSKRIGVSKGV
jgi:hypothetical protein